MNKNTCKTCDQEKSISEFYKSTKTTSGYRNTCKKCCAHQAANRYEKTKTFVGHNQANLPLPSNNWLHDNFDYHHDGYFIRKITRGRSSVGAKVQGKLEENGYYRVNISYSALLLHRLIWKWHYGTEPKFIDHIDKIRVNCRIDNLREASKNENARNQVLPENNTSGFYCIRWHEYSGHAGKWTVKLSHDGDSTTASFQCITRAVYWYCKKAHELHGEFAIDKIAHNKQALKNYLDQNKI